MISLQTEIKGLAKTLILGTLTGVVVGAFGGCLYGNVLKRTAIAKEIQKIQAGRVNYTSKDGQPTSKVMDHIAIEARKAGLKLGIPLGTFAGIAAGTVWGVLGRFNRPGDSH
jgi:hypothetical protein